jgi:hypothetical protein
MCVGVVDEEERGGKCRMGMYAMRAKRVVN